MDSPAAPSDDVLIAELAQHYANIVTQIDKRIVGQRGAIDLLVNALFAGGHCLFVGVPGLAKTLLVATFADAVSLSFARVQFTPDLMPSDITGTEVIDQDLATGHRSFRFVQGPVFTNLLLADEINRAPAKTQAALLQAMQEQRITAGGQTMALPDPFMVLATQNPIEQEGTYPLPEAQLDRFLFQIDVDYPSQAEEERIAMAGASPPTSGPVPVIAPADVLTMQQLVRRVPAAPHVVAYAVALTRATRPDDVSAPPVVKEHVRWGAGPRASQHLVLAAKARAAIAGRYVASVDDVAAMAPPVLAHRVLLSYRAAVAGQRAADVVSQLLAKVKP